MYARNLLVLTECSLVVFTAVASITSTRSFVPKTLFHHTEVWVLYFFVVYEWKAVSGGEKRNMSFGQSCPSVINPASRVPRLSGGVVGARQRDVDCVSSLQNKSKPCRKRVHLVQTWKSHPSGRSWTQLKVSVLCFDLVSDWLWACERLYGCDHSGFLWVRPAQTLQVYGHKIYCWFPVSVFTLATLSEIIILSFHAPLLSHFLFCVFSLILYMRCSSTGGCSQKTAKVSELMLVYVKVISVRGELRLQNFFFYPWIFMMSVSADIPCMVISAFQFRRWAQKPN